MSGGKPPEPPWGALSSPQRRQAPLPPERGATPGSLSVNKIPAAPRIDSRKCFPGKAWGENKARLPTSPKWQIDLLLWLKIARRETERSAASAKRAVTLHRGIPKGAALGAPLVTFPATGKSPGCRAERLHWGCWDYQSRKKLRVQGGAPASRGVQRGQHPLAFRSAAAPSAAIIPHPPAPGHSEKKKSKVNVSLPSSACKAGVVS